MAQKGQKTMMSFFNRSNTKATAEDKVAADKEKEKLKVKETPKEVAPTQSPAKRPTASAPESPKEQPAKKPRLRKANVLFSDESDSEETQKENSPPDEVKDGAKEKLKKEAPSQAVVAAEVTAMEVDKEGEKAQEAPKSTAPTPEADAPEVKEEKAAPAKPSAKAAANEKSAVHPMFAMGKKAAASKPAAAKKEKKEETKEKKEETKEKKEDDTEVKEVEEGKEGDKEEVKEEEEEEAPAAKSKSPVKAKTAPVKKGEEISYSPDKDKYDPVEDACWKKGERVPYAALAATFEAIEKTTKRLQITDILCNLIRSVMALTPEDLLQALYLCMNRLGPTYEGEELGVGDSLLMKAIKEATGRRMEDIKNEYQRLGDLGLVAQHSRTQQRTLVAPKPLTVAAVFKALKSIAALTGNASGQRKVENIHKLIVTSRTVEAKYIIRSLTGKLRIGLAEQSVLAALAQAAYITRLETDGKKLKAGSEEYAKGLAEAMMLVKTAYCELPNLDRIVPVLLAKGLEALPTQCTLTPGIPLKPMLAHPTKGIAEILRRFEGMKFTCEYKYDGERAQIHMLEGGQVHIYSRNQEDNTKKYPDVIARIPQIVKEGVKSFIIDSEVVAWDVTEKKILPFQVLSTRKRKEADKDEIKVQVCLFAFDLLYLNGQSYVREPLEVRREKLRESFVPVEGLLQWAESKDAEDTETIESFLDESVKGSCEGLMIKTLQQEATYEISKRSHNWLKLKKDYLEGVGDSLDLVVVGADWGAGKRTGTFGNFLLACYDDETEEYQSICKVGTGLSDVQLQEFSAFFKQHISPECKKYYKMGDCKPDVWFDPVQVWEIRAADLSVSPKYKAAEGLVHGTKGISLRFPRLVRIRDDKTPELATTAQQVAELYQAQSLRVSNHGHSGPSEEY